VFIDGVPCPFLEVTEIVRQGSPSFGYAKLQYNRAAHEGPQPAGIEQAERTAAMGKTVEICRLVNTGIGEVKIEPVCVFAGEVEQVERKLSSGEQVLEITAEDSAARPPGSGRIVELNLQYAGEKLSISRTNVCELESEKQNEPADSGIIEVINVQTPILAMHYEVGDRVTVSPDSRDILGVRRDNRSIFWIGRVRMDFERQCTDLRIFRKRA